jgi:hypothetical protein
LLFNATFSNIYENGCSSPSGISTLFLFSNLAIPFIPLVLSLNYFAFKSFAFEHTTDSDYPFVIFKLFFELRIPITPLLSSNSSSNYGFRLSLWYLQTLLRITIFCLWAYLMKIISRALI